MSEPFDIPDGPMTAQEVMAQVERYFEEGNGNRILREPLVSHFKKTGEIVHAVMATFKLERIVMYRKRK